MSVANNFNEEYFVNTIVKKILNSESDIQKQWNNPIGTKTKYFYIDELLSKDDVNKIYQAFPKNGKGFFDRNTFREKKKTSANLGDYEKILSEITYAFQNKKVVDLISKILNLDMVEPDPKLYAGGLSMMFKNDYLNPHIDNSHDIKRNRYRRLNLLYYVSPNWSYENGGNFELWDENKIKPVTIVSLQNRLVVMETNKSSWHSVSKVLSKNPRCCVSNYYFSQISPDGSNYFHVTSFTGRPGEHLKILLSGVDNLLRNFISKVFKIGRGKNLINKNK